jgi:hypothetical protein
MKKRKRNKGINKGINKLKKRENELMKKVTFFYCKKVIKKCRR